MRIPFEIPAPAGRACDVAGLGLNSIDLVAVVDGFPTSNTKQALERFVRLPGGQIATALSACARLGWRTRYVGSFGGDDLGRLSRESLVQEGVDVSASRIIDQATNQFAVVLVDSRSGDRTVLWNRHPALSMTASDVPVDAVTSGRMLIVDCFETTAATEAARLARGAGVPTIVDVEKVRPGVGQLLTHIDAIIAAESFPSALTGCADLGRALQTMQDEFRAPLVCVTLGEHGSLARCRGRELRTSSVAVECVDTTGAGDAFRGGFAAGCLRAPDGDIEDVLRYANAVAGLNCRALGARGGLPSSGEVDQLLYGKF